MSNEYTPIDVNRSLVPLNPEAVSESITYDPRTRSNPIPYSGKNILPTDLGYTSFFGLGNTIGASTLLKDVQEILSYRTLTGDTLLFALCRDGCYFRALAGDGTPVLTSVAAAPPEPAKIKVDLQGDELASWTFLFNSPQGSTSPWHLWTQALLENELYLYQKGMKFIAKISSTEKGQFFVEKLLPAYIISNVAKIYRYVASLSVVDPSAFAFRTITWKGIETKVFTNTPAATANAHGAFVERLNSAGLGASLQNYQKESQESLVFSVVRTNYIIPRDPIGDVPYSLYTLKQSSGSPIWAGALTITIRGTAINIPVIANGDSYTVVTYIADTINAAALSGVLAYPVVGRMGDPGYPELNIFVEEIAGNRTLTLSQAGGNSPVWIKSPTTNNYPNLFNKSKYKFAPVYNLYKVTDVSVGIVYSYADANINVSYTATAEDTDTGVYNKFRRLIEAAGYPEAYYIDSIFPAINIAIDYAATTYPSITLSSYELNNYSGYNSIIEKIPSSEKLSITSTGTLLQRRTLTPITYLKRHSDDSTDGHVEHILNLPNTGGQLIFKIRGEAAYGDDTTRLIGGEYYTYTYPSWSTVSAAYAVYTNLVTFLNSLPDIGSHLISGPTPASPTNNLRIALRTEPPAELYTSLGSSRKLISVKLGLTELIENLTGSLIFAYLGQATNYICTLQFTQSDALAYGTSMGVAINGQSATWTWNTSGANLATIQAAITGMSNFVSFDSAGEAGGAVTLVVKFNGVRNSIGFPISVTNGALSAGTVEISGVYNANDVVYSDFFEEHAVAIPVSQDYHTITFGVDGTDYTIEIEETDDRSAIYTKVLLALNTLLPNGYKILVLNDLYNKAKYTGDIIFSITSLDGSDPLTTVGATSSSEPFTITSATNETIELAQVEGIAASRGRLLAWDYTNTLYLGSAVDPTDFTPSVTTQANSYRVDAIKGNIVLILPHPEGAVIYSTGNIVKSTYQGGGSQQVFSYRAMNERGSIDPRHIAKGPNEHYLIGSEGLYTVDYGKNEVSLIGKELTDFLKRYKFPIQLQMIGNRYLVVNLLEAPPTVDAKAWREGSATPYQLGEGTRTVRPVQVLSIPDVPFGQNLFPLFTNAMIYDAVLDKWGYATLDYKHLFSINPTNQEGYPAEKDYALREAAFYNDVRSLAALLPDGSTVLLNDSPDSSYIVYGKYLLSRSHYTKVLKVEAQFLDYPDCTISLEPSMDGRLIDYDNIKESAAIGTPGFRWPIMAVARWFNILVKGKFNLTGLSIEGKRDGRRP